MKDYNKDREELERIERDLEALKKAHRDIIKSTTHAWWTMLKRERQAYKKAIYELKHREGYTYIDMDGVCYIGIVLLIAELIALLIYFTQVEHFVKNLTQFIVDK